MDCIALATHTHDFHQELIDPYLEDRWAFVNRRRVFLINQEFAGGLTPDQTEELTRLQAEIGKTHVQVIAPLPFSTLAELERRVHEAQDHTNTPPPNHEHAEA